MEPKNFEIFLNEVKFDDKPNQAHRDELEKKLIANLSKQPQQKTIARWIFHSRILKFAAAAVILIAVVLGLNYFGRSFSFTSVAWADVAEKFQSVEFFSVVFYEKDDALAQPEQIELWMGQGGNVRMRMGSQVIFGKDGLITKTFDISKHSVVEPDSRAKRMLEMLAGMGDRFSLNSLLNIAAGGKLTNVTPLINSDAIISEDLVVFDIKLNDIQWMRIWALRESKLPVQLRIWGSQFGSCLDAFLTYSNQQPKEFFDPNAFEQAFRQQQENNRSNIAYAFLTDPGGEDITPKDMFKKSGGYHTPVVKQSGITKEGAVWVLSSKARNRMPNGNEFYGFSQIKDDLSRKYISVGGGWRLADDTSLDVFLPIDFPFDNNRPFKITLICDTKEYDPIIKPELIGTVDLTQWDVNAPCPNLFGNGFADAQSWKIALAYRLFADEHKERLSRLVKTIPDWQQQPDNKSLLQFWMRLSYKQKDYAKVNNIGQALLPIMLKDTRNPPRYDIHDYLMSLGITGQIDKAAELFKQINTVNNIDPAKKSDEGYVQFVKYIVEELAMSTELQPEQISKIVGFDITQREEYKNAVQMAKEAVANKKSREAAEKRRQELANYYQSHPLPEKMELQVRLVKEGIYLVNVPNTVPNHEDYIIQPINGKIRGFVSNLRIFGNIQPYELVPMRVEDVNIEQEIYADLIYKKGTSRLEQTEFVLNHFGMELVIEDGPSRKVLVAKYNGQTLNNFNTIKVPLSYDNTKESKVGMLASSTSNGFRMTDLLDDLARQQNKDIKKDDEKLIIVNETALDFESGPVSDKMALWPGKEGLEKAKQWFKEQFGVTFTEETRPMKTYVIRKHK
jgi:hypothetical protein